jgi:hypothetical protein
MPRMGEWWIERSVLDAIWRLRRDFFWHRATERTIHQANDWHISGSPCLSSSTLSAVKILSFVTFV